LLAELASAFFVEAAPMLQGRGMRMKLRLLSREALFHALEASPGAFTRRGSGVRLSGAAPAVAAGPRPGEEGA